MAKAYEYFSHRACEFFPCHPGADPQNFNCLFCFCPLYFLGDACGGAFTRLEDGTKDCSACLFPHRRENYGAVLARVTEAIREERSKAKREAKKMEIRTAQPENLAQIAAVEAACFPPAEAATPAELAERLARYANHFWLLWAGETLLAFVDGMVTDEPDLTDAMYQRADWHNEAGAWQMIFGVNTLPGYRNRGYAGRLLRRAIADARAQGRKGLVLTCKEGLLPYYAGFGFVDEGVSEKSTHGNAVWHQMRLTF